MTRKQIEERIQIVKAQIAYGELTEDYFYTYGRGLQLQAELTHLRTMLMKVEG